ncbi:MAG TPA: hypothetical protein VJR89_09715 [Polyangiales bacterium]|nr:hypothetical protein [Polyangiales bacterium]
MPIPRESEPPGPAQASFEESAVRRAPQDLDDDAYELQDHEFTLEPEEPEVAAAPANAGEEHTAPWSTLRPLPPWATTARELLERDPAPSDAIAYDDEPTPAELSASEALALRAELAHATRLVSEQRRELERLERGLSELRGALAAAHAELAHERGRAAGQALLIAELGSQRDVPRAVQLPAAAPSPAPDDLCRIRGLGPRAAERLHAIGVTRFSEIASWTAFDLERVATQLGLRAARIQREGWVRQARTLQARSAKPERKPAARAKKAAKPPRRKAAPRKRTVR